MVKTKPTKQEEEVDNKPKNETAEAEQTSIDVIGGVNKDRYIRTYSVQDQGENFMELANQFVTKPEYSKRGYATIHSSKIKSVLVLYREKEDANLPIDKQKSDSPMVDKQQSFTDKAEATRFAVVKKGTMIAEFA